MCVRACLRQLLSSPPSCPPVRANCDAPWPSKAAADKQRVGLRERRRRLSTGLSSTTTQERTRHLSSPRAFSSSRDCGPWECARQLTGTDYYSSNCVCVCCARGWKSSRLCTNPRLMRQRRPTRRGRSEPNASPSALGTLCLAAFPTSVCVNGVVFLCLSPVASG